MRKFFIIGFVVLLTLAGCDLFDDDDNSPPRAVTVSQVGNQRGDVILTGRITAWVSPTRYTFQDDTGSITVHIENEYFFYAGITPPPSINDTRFPINVEIVGDVERSGNSVIEIDVDSVRLLP